MVTSRVRAASVERRLTSKRKSALAPGLLVSVGDASVGALLIAL
jgi:hypothetical protein